MRLDLFLTKAFHIQSRNKAHELIKANKIKIDGVIISKPSFKVEKEHSVEILEDSFYVSRAAYKLKYFLDEIKLNLKNLDALDIGSSTGGFSQILLEQNVKTITCVDVGSNQLHKRLKDNQKIEFYENCDIRDFEAKKEYQIVTCDVSFISLHYILNAIDKLASKYIILLFKPQFEVGTNIKRDKKGMVKDTKAIAQARTKLLDAISLLSWDLKKTALSKLEGKDGNIEELFYFEKNLGNKI